jgi:hypothetical protein
LEQRLGSGVIAPKSRVRPRYVRSRPWPSKEGLADRMTAPLAYGVAGVKDRPAPLRRAQGRLRSLNGASHFVGPPIYREGSLAARSRSAGSGWVSIRERMFLVPNRSFLPRGARQPVCASLPSPVAGPRRGPGKPLQVPIIKADVAGGKRASFSRSYLPLAVERERSVKGARDKKRVCERLYAAATLRKRSEIGLEVPSPAPSRQSA